MEDKASLFHAVRCLREDLQVLQDGLVNLESKLGRLGSGNLTSGSRTVRESDQQVDIETINRSLERMASASSQEEILDVLLAETCRYVDRAILFREDQGEYGAWKCRGFNSNRCYGVSLREADSMILQAASHLQVISRDENILSSLPWLGGLGPLPGFCFSVPLRFDRYVPLVLYADSSHRVSVASVELLARLTVLQLQNQYQAFLLRQVDERDEVPVRAADAQTVEEKSEPFSEKGSESEAEREPGEDAGLPEVDLRGLDELSADQEVAWSSPREEKSDDRKEVWSEEGEKEGKVSSVETELEIEDGEVPLPQEEELFFAEPEPVDLTPEEEETMHGEARRLARLLVAEIKLYNEAAVEEGRDKSDLYRLLRTDIDRSRNMYDKRVHPTIRSQADYFHSELVRVLAQENPELMGSDYPGTKVSNPIGPAESQRNGSEETVDPN